MKKTANPADPPGFLLNDGKRRPFTDPVTGDKLTMGEEMSWLAQGVIRRWAFILIITIVTIVVWSVGNTMALSWWNLSASYLALLIESTVGIAMFSQTRRDAVLIRRIDRNEAQNCEILASLKASADRQGTIIAHQEHQLERAGKIRGQLVALGAPHEPEEIL